MGLPHSCRLLSGVLAIILIALASQARATEYDLFGYVANPQAVASAIGSNDDKLRDRLLAMKDYVDKNGLEQRFTDPTIWRTAVADLVAGRTITNDFINGFVIEMLLQVIGEPARPNNLGPPFADLDDAADYFTARGNSDLAQFLRLISWGNTVGDEPGLPSALKGKLGMTEYAARISVLSPDDAKALLALLPQVEEAHQELDAFRDGETGSAANAAKAVIERATRAKWTAYYEKDKDQLEGRPLEDVLNETVKSVLKDPYNYGDDLDELANETKDLGGWLKQAVEADKALFLVYQAN